MHTVESRIYVVLRFSECSNVSARGNAFVCRLLQGLGSKDVQGERSEETIGRCPVGGCAVFEAVTVVQELSRQAVARDAWSRR